MRQEPDSVSRILLYLRGNRDQLRPIARRILSPSQILPVACPGRSSQESLQCHSINLALYLGLFASCSSCCCSRRVFPPCFHCMCLHCGKASCNTRRQELGLESRHTWTAGHGRHINCLTDIAWGRCNTYAELSRSVYTYYARPSA